MLKSSILSVYIYLAIFMGSIFVYKLQKDYTNRRRHMFIASSFYIEELPRTLIRSLAVVEKSLFDPKLICEVDGRFAPARVRRLELFIGCKWGIYFIECPSKQPPQNFYLRGDNSVKHEIQITKPESKKRGFVVCFSRMFFFERWQAALTAIHMYKFHGVDLMVIPIISVIKEMFEMLQEYEKEGWIHLKRAAMIPKIPDLGYNPNAEVDWFLQVLNFDECLYEYRNADFIAFADLDDIMIPRHTHNLHAEMLQLSAANPNLASFEFNWQWSSAIISPEPEKFNLNAVIGSIFVHFDAPKFTMRGEVLSGYEHKWFRKNSTTVIHMRHIFTEAHPTHPNISNTLFGNDSRYQIVQQDFQGFLQRNPKAMEAFLRLPSKMSYYDALHNKCPRQNDFKRCHSALFCMPESSDDLPECVILKFDSKSTLISNNWIIYTTSGSHFVPKSNCLM